MQPRVDGPHVRLAAIRADFELVGRRRYLKTLITASAGIPGPGCILSISTLKPHYRPWRSPTVVEVRFGDA